MSRSHNKKRNSGLIYEFLVRHISKALVDGDVKESSKALKIVKKYFKPGTQLHREFRLINSLMKTTVGSTPVAATILSEARQAALAYDQKELNREKSLLIRTINHTLDESVYTHQVDDYRMYATIQTLINEWRKGDLLEFARKATYEDMLIEWLMTKKSPTPDVMIESDNPGTSRLLMNVMTKKLNEKYGQALTKEQKDLIRAYAWSKQEDGRNLSEKLEEIRGHLVGSIGEYSSLNESNKYVLDKLDKVKEKLMNENVNEINDEMITRFMQYCHLSDELQQGDKDE